jgi:hypothetical protein
MSSRKPYQQMELRPIFECLNFGAIEIDRCKPIISTTMDHATQWLFFLAPFLIFATVFLVVFLGVRAAVNRMRDGLTSTVNAKEIHLRTQWGSLDVHPAGSLDPRLSKIMMYPGAAPLDSGVSSYQAELHLLDRDIKEASAKYWTSTPEQIVWEFYQRELPDWQQKPGKKLVKEADGYRQGIQVQTAGDRTIIEIAISTASLAAGTS